MDIPQELICNLCENLIDDAVVLPCCAGSVCLDCGRKALDEKNACPLGDCLSEEVFPDELIPNRRLRQKASDLKDKISTPSETKSSLCLFDSNSNCGGGDLDDPVVESTTNDDVRISLEVSDNNNPSIVESTTNDDEDSNHLVEGYDLPTENSSVDLVVSTEVRTESPTPSSHSPQESLFPPKDDQSLENEEEGEKKESKSEEPPEKSPVEGTRFTANDSPVQPENGSLEEKDEGRVDKVEEEETSEKESKDECSIPKTPPSKDEPTEIKTTYGDHSVSIPSEYMNVAKEDPLAAFQKLMEAKDKQKGIVNSTQYYGTIPNTYPEYVNQYAYSPYTTHAAASYPPPYFTDPYVSYGVSSSMSGYNHYHRDRHSTSKRESRKYAPYSERTSSEKRHRSSSRYSCKSGGDHFYDDRKRSHDRSSSKGSTEVRRKESDRHQSSSTRKRDRSFPSLSKSHHEKKIKKSKKSERSDEKTSSYRSVSEKESKLTRKKKESKKHRTSQSKKQQTDEVESKHRKEEKQSLKKKSSRNKSDSSSSSESSSSSSSSSSSGSSSSSSGGEDDEGGDSSDSSSSSSSSSDSSAENSSNKKRGKTNKKQPSSMKKKAVESGKKKKKKKNAKDTNKFVLDQIIEEHSKDVDTLVDKKRKKSKRRKSSH